MSIGYMKGKWWVPDERYAGWSERDVYKALLRANFKAGYGTNVEYSYTARRYMAEITTIERFEKSAQLYIIKHNNAYDPHPMVALTRAIRESGRATPFALVCCLELECLVLKETLAIARRREANMAKLEEAIDMLAGAIGKIFVPYECQNCIGMIEHGCYCMAVGAPAPGVGPFDMDDDL